MRKLRGWSRLLILASSGLFLLFLTEVSGDPADLGPGFEIGVKPVYGPAPGYQEISAVATNGTAYFVAWNDPRSASSDDIYGSRVTADGLVLDPAGIALTTSAANQDDPAISFDGTNYLVVWKDARNGINCDIYGARVSPTGALLDSAGLAISVTPESQADPSIAFGNTAYLVVWADARNGVSNIYGARVTPAGTVLDPSGVAICTETGGQSYPQVAFDGEAWLVVWQDNRDGEPDVYGARVALDGSVVDPVGIAISSNTGDQIYPSVAARTGSFLVAWDDNRSGTSRDIYAARVSGGGVVLDPSGFAISTLKSDEEFPAVTFDGTDYFVVWDDIRGGATWDLYAARVDTAGTVLDPAGRLVTAYPSQEFGASVASNGTNILTTWHDSRNGPKDIYGIRSAKDGSVLDGKQILISAAAGYQAYPAAASNGTAYLMAWHELRLDSGYDLFGTRLAGDGTALDTLGIGISTAAGDQMYPAVASGTANWLVAWQDYRSGGYDIYGARVAMNGTVLDAAGLVISGQTGPQEYPAVAFDGTNYLVVWQDKRSGSYDIYGARIGQDGTILDAAGIPISTATGDQLHPTLAFDGTNYLVAWQDYRGATSDIYGARVSPGGAVLDASGIVISAASDAQEWPKMAFDGTNYLVVWQDKRGGPYADIYGARVATSGTLIDGSGIAISTAVNEQLAPSVAFDGWKYLVVWQDKRSASTSPDVYGALIDKAGTVLDPRGFAIAKINYNQMSPMVCAGPSGQMLVAYSSFTLPPTYGSYRIWANFYNSQAGAPGGDTDPSPSRLCEVSPNPFFGSTLVRFYLPSPARVSADIYDIHGRLVKSLAGTEREAGPFEVSWDGTRADAQPVAPGMYFLKVEVGAARRTEKVILLR